MYFLCIVHVFNFHSLRITVQATVLEEMPAFADKESSLLNKLYETAPWTAKLHQQDQEPGSAALAAPELTELPIVNGVSEPMLNIGQPVDPLINTSESQVC